MTDTMDLQHVADTLPPSLLNLVKDAKALYQRHFSSVNSNKNAYITVAPGRVNLIGEHTDYTGGFVLPLAIDYSTVVYGTGTLRHGSFTRTKCLLVSRKDPYTVEECTLSSSSKPPSADSPRSWTWYVMGVIAQYLPDLPEHSSLDLSLAIAGNVPLGSGLSSSASLEVAVARFVEEVLGEHAFSSESKNDAPSKTRALRCQTAENKWCHSPCGIMDQYVSSAASEGTLLLIDCTSLEYQPVQMAAVEDRPVLCVCNSNVSHDIAGGEYPVRVAQCQSATAALQSVNASIQTLRDATLQDVEQAKSVMDDVGYRRAKHVVTENARTLQTKEALEAGDWNQVGALMNASHASMRDDYEVSCDEIDVLVNLAQPFEGVYGSRLTGGGFGGCTVTLVKQSRVQDLMECLQKEYKAKTGLDCFCFETSPANGARLLATDTL